MGLDNLTLISIVAVTAMAAVAALTISRVLAGRTSHPVMRRTITLMVRGPVIASIVGGGLIELLEYVHSMSPGTLPSSLSPGDFMLIVELVILAITVRVVGSIVKTISRSFEHMRETERVLVYIVYGFGLIAMIYVLLSSPVSPTVASNVWAIVNFMAGILMTYLVVSTVNIIVKRYSAGIATRDEKLGTALAFVRRLGLATIAVIGVAITTFASFPAAGAAIASLFIAAGFGSIVIGLAAQSSLANIFAGIVLSTAQPIKIGNAVLFQMPWGAEWCWVEDMRLNFTILKTWDNRRLVIPNALFLNSSFVNYDLNDSSKLCIVYVTITYESNLDRAIEIMKEAARRHPDFLPAGNLPVVHLMDIGDANGAASDANASPGLSLRLLSRAKDQPTNFQMSKDLLYTIRKEFQKSGIQIAYPRREVMMMQGRPDDPSSPARSVEAHLRDDETR